MTRKDDNYGGSVAASSSVMSGSFVDSDDRPSGGGEVVGITTKLSIQKYPDCVIVHPLVLLSVADHYNRVARKTSNRVVGVLLGQSLKSSDGRITINVANSFAVPFEEEEATVASKNSDYSSNVWFLDHNYVETMAAMFRKVNARETIIGWYHTGPSLRASDLEINALFKSIIHHDPVLVVVDINPDLVGMPADSYFAIEEIKDDGSPKSTTFMHIPCAIEAEEAEEIGVEHLLRDIKGSSIGALSACLHDRLMSLESLSSRLMSIRNYLDAVANGHLPVNHPIIANLQHVFNLMPHLDSPALTRAFQVQTNDEWMIMYLASVVRAVMALHNLIDNKITNKEAEEQRPFHQPAFSNNSSGSNVNANSISGSSSTSCNGTEPSTDVPEKKNKNSSNNNQGGNDGCNDNSYNNQKAEEN